MFSKEQKLRIREKDLTEIINVVGSSGLKAIDSSSPDASDYCQSLTEFVWIMLAQFERSDNINIDETLCLRRLLTKTLRLTHSFIDRSISINNHQIGDHLFHLSSIYAFLIYFSTISEKCDFQEEFESAVNALIEIYNRRCKLSEEDISFGCVKLISYIKLFGAWMSQHFPDSNERSAVLKFLSQNRSDDQSVNSQIMFISIYERLGYPTHVMMNDGWSLFHSTFWGDVHHNNVVELLNNISNYRQFDADVRAVVGNDNC